MAGTAYQALQIVLEHYAPSVKERLVIDCSGYGYDDLRSRSLLGLSELKREIRERHAMCEEDLVEQQRSLEDPSPPPRPDYCDHSVDYYVFGCRRQSCRCPEARH